MSKKNTFLSAIPTPIAGLALAISGLGLTLTDAGVWHHIPQIIGAAIAAGVLLFLSLKFLVHPHLPKADLAHPVIGGAIAAFSETLLMVSYAIGIFSLVASQIVWVIALVIHLIFLLTFAYHRLRQFKLDHLVPTWFLPTVGSLVAVMTFPGGTALLPLAYVILTIGMLFALFLLPLTLYRLFFGQEVPDPAKPTIAIIAAPASLSLAAYLILVQSPSPILVALLAGAATLMTLVTYVLFFRLLRLPFSPAYSAYTFPIVVSARALLDTSHWMAKIGVPQHYITQVRVLMWIEFAIGAVIVAYVTLGFIWYFYQRIQQASAAKGASQKLSA